MVKIEESEGRKFWVVSIDSEELFARIGRDANYREHAMQSGGGKYVLLEEDRGMFDRLMKSAVGELWLKLARMSKMVSKPVLHNEDATLIRLEVHGNYDDHVLFVLDGGVEDFLEGYVLREWYVRNNVRDEAAKCEVAMSGALARILSVVHYRKKAVKRPIDPVF